MNPQLVCQWYEQYRTGIYRFALSILRDSQQAEDVLQETFVRLLSGKFTCPSPGREKAWLYRVARNLCYDLLRQRTREQELSREVAASSKEIPEFFQLIAPLAPKEQELVSLKILGGFSHREIAAITGTTVHATKKRYERAIQKLRQEMEVTL